jgi:hypothetical protein
MPNEIHACRIESGIQNANRTPICQIKIHECREIQIKTQRKLGANDTLRETPSAEGNFRAQGKKNFRVQGKKDAEFKRLTVGEYTPPNAGI